MNTSAILLIPVLHGFNGHSNNSSRKEAIILNETLMAKCTFVTPKKHRCVFWTRSSLSGVGLYSADAPRYGARWKRQITSVTEQPSWPHWNGNLRESAVRSKSLFLSFPQILFEKLLTDANDASVQPKKHLKALFWCFIQTYICLWSVW